MEILRAVLLAVEAIVSLLLIVIILVQRSKSEGLGLAFGANVGETLFGSRAGNVLTKMTVTLGIVFLANTLALAMIYSGERESSLMGRVAPRAPQRTELPPRAVQSTPSRPALPPSGIPTLPGATLSDETPSPAEAPAAAVVETAPEPPAEAPPAEGEAAPQP